jgi:hypothetical protein
MLLALCIHCVLAINPIHHTASARTCLALHQAGEFSIPGSSGHGGTVTGGSTAHGGSGASGSSAVLCLNSTTVGLLFPTAFERLDVRFYR